MGKREKGLSRTSGCPWFAGRRSEASAPQAPADSGGLLRRCGVPVGEGERWRGRWASGGGRGAIPGLSLGEGRPEVETPREQDDGGHGVSRWQLAGGLGRW